MNDIAAAIETMEHRWMRAWIAGDKKLLKRLTSKNFRLLISSKPAALLDAPSWFEAAASGFSCRSYRFGEIYVRGHGSTAIFACRIEIEATLDGSDWSGEIWATDLWRKGRLRRSWRMVERVLSRPEERDHVPAAIRSLQLWRR